MTDVTVADQGAGAPPSNSPFQQPIRPESRREPASQPPERTDLGEARRIADQTAQQRFVEQRADTGSERIGDRQLTDEQVSKLTYSERKEYADRRAELANAEKPTDGSSPTDQPAAETKHKFGDDIELTGSEIKGLLERHALEQSRKALLPADPSGYELKLPEGFKVPQGVELTFNEQAPEFSDFRAWAHREGLSQAQVSDVLGIYSTMKVREQTTLRQARDAEITKLGSAARLRVSAAETFLRGHLGEDLGRAMSTMLVTAKHVEAVEKLMTTFRNQGAGAFSPPRAPSEPARISDAEYSQMSYGEQKAYAERMSYGNNGGRR